jgi:surface polysaccharide O-acyltransferase-like enzyme
MSIAAAEVETASSVDAGPVQRQGERPRLAFVDNVRWTMIILVLSMHASDTYSPFGNWYFTDRAKASFATVAAFGFYQTFLQAFFMALLFFIAGYFAVPALARRGRAGFIQERFVRLGLPTLLFMLAIGPLTQYFLSRTWGSGGFAYQWLVHLLNGQWLSETGPMWFCAALLAFSLVYAFAPAPKPEKATESSYPGTWGIAAFVLAMASATFVTRIFVPENVAILNMHFGDFPQYILMFAAGTLAWRGRWIERFPARAAFAWLFACLAIALPLFVVLIAAGGALHGVTAPYNGGVTLVSAGKCLFEALVCVGMAMGILALYRSRFDRSGPLSAALSASAFAVYLFHPPVLIAIALGLRGVLLPPLLKALLLTALSAVVAFSLCHFLLRRIPVLKRIL